MKNLALLYPDVLVPESPAFRDTGDFLSRNTPDQPVLLFSRNRLQRTAYRFQELFPGEVSYAVKANPECMILSGLWDAGIRSFDVASLAEIIQVRQLLPNSELHFNNPIRTRSDTERAYRDFGVHSFVIDDLAGLKGLEGIADPQTEITVRFKLNDHKAAYDFGSKFGATVDEAATLCRLAGHTGSRISLTFHPGSQCTDPWEYDRYIRAAAGICAASGVRIHRLNVGGGFPIAYPGTQIPDTENFVETISHSVATHFPAHRPDLLCEPGRAMVAESASLLAQVIHVRDGGDVFVNDGVYGSFQEHSLMPHGHPVRTWRGNAQITGETRPAQIFGPTCDPIDRLSTSIDVPLDVRPGDYLEFGLLGAYGSATATHFNGFTPAGYQAVEFGF